MLRKNTAGQFVHIAGINVSTGAIVSGATWSMRRCLDGTFAAGGATITEDTGLGFYKVALTQADTNGNDIGYFFTATNCVPVTLNVITTACDPTSTAFGLSLAKTTNITGFNDIAATAIVSSGAITTSGGAVSTVTSVSGSVGSVTGAVGSVTGNVGGNVVGSVGSVTGSVGSVTAGVTVTTNNDKTGYSLSQSFPNNFASLVISAAGIASADIKKVNGITVNGDGNATPWGP